MRPSRPTIILAVICLGLLAVVAWVSLLPELPLPQADNPPANTPQGRANAANGKPVVTVDYDHISKRPLFTPDRRLEPPLVAKPGTVPPPVRPPPSLVLLGTIIDQGERIAFVRLAGQSHGRAVRIDEPVGDWKISEILVNRIVLENGPQKHVVVANASGSTTQPAPAIPVHPNQIRR